jgi:hypothetical protein
MNEHKTDHMTPEEFRRYGRQVVDWIADYYENIESMPVLSRSKPERGYLPYSHRYARSTYAAVLCRPDQH